VAGLTARALSKLTLPDGAEDFLSLPPPEQSALAAARAPTLHAAAEAFVRSWEALLACYPPPFALPTAFRCPTCGALHELDEQSSWNQLFLTIGAYYDFAVGRLLCEAAPGRPVAIPYPSLRVICPVMAQATSDDAPAFFISAALLGGHYITCLIASDMVPVLTHTAIPRGRVRIGDPVARLEAVAHDTFAYLLADTRKSPTPEQRALAARMTSTLAKYLAHCYRGMADIRPHACEYGSFSDLRPAELPLLAEREPTAVRRYGAKRVERALEQQLAMIFQSLGFYVVPARRGERTVDLVCISGDQANRFTFLLDAKSSRRPYTLPVSDERALAEYIRELPKAIPSISPPRFVIVVGGTPGRTLGRRLSRLQSATGVPVRFLAAREIARLRELAPSLLPMSIFCDHVLEGPTVLPDGFGRMLAEKYGAAQAAHSAFAKTMLSLRPQMNVRPDEGLVWCRQAAPSESREGAE
jgi:hypothetical protein